MTAEIPLHPATRLPDKKPFTIGIEPLDRSRWIEPDEKLSAELTLKQELFTHHCSDVFRAEQDTHQSQLEMRDALIAFLTAHHPQLYHRNRHIIHVNKKPVALSDEPPLLTASRLVQDDLCIMRASPGGWRLVAACLCFPSTWVLEEKFGQSMTDIHAPVPGFAGTMNNRVQRIFDSLQPDYPVWRMNWSIYDNAALRHAHTHSGPPVWHRKGIDPGKNAFLRIERQSLMKMPVSRDILFTIRIYLDPLQAFTHASQPVITAMRNQLLAMDAPQLAYKNLLQDRDDMATALLQMMQ
ncbi:MAG: heme-dependent oxidative N-demethylase family protein [Beijerinckiaceae bacterium]